MAVDLGRAVLLAAARLLGGIPVRAPTRRERTRASLLISRAPVDSSLPSQIAIERQKHENSKQLFHLFLFLT
jgi:hypothetical protein